MVRVVFGGLALIFAISFVFLGVGTGGGGFSFSDLFGGGSGSSSTAFDDDIIPPRRSSPPTRTTPSTLGHLVQLHYSAANSNTDSNGAPTSDGVQQLREAADAWNKYVKASKGNISATGSRSMPSTPSTSSLGSISRRPAPTRARRGAHRRERRGRRLEERRPGAAGPDQQAAENVNANAYRPSPSTSTWPATRRAVIRRRRRPRGKGPPARIDQPAQADQAARPAAPGRDQAARKQQQQTQGAGGATGGATGGEPAEPTARRPRHRRLAAAANSSSGQLRPPQPFLYFRPPPGPLAQLVEQETLNLKVTGSIPVRPINEVRTQRTLIKSSQAESRGAGREAQQAHVRRR